MFISIATVWILVVLALVAVLVLLWAAGYILLLDDRLKASQHRFRQGYDLYRAETVKHAETRAVAARAVHVLADEIVDLVWLDTTDIGDDVARSTFKHGLITAAGQGRSGRVLELIDVTNPTFYRGEFRG